MTVSGKQVARDSLLNLAGQGLPLFVGLLAVPYVVHRLSPEKFGLLSLVWALLGTFALFNFGLSRATTKFVAESVAAGEEQNLAPIIWTSFWLQILAAGCVALVALFAVNFAIAILKIPAAVVDEAKDTLRVLAASIPVVVGALAWRGVLEGAGRFDLVNVVRGPLVASVFLLPVLVLPFGFGPCAMAALMILSWLGAGALYAVFAFRRFPGLRSPAVDLSRVRHLAVFGGWVSVSNLITPAYIYFDRFLISSMVSLVAVGYYSAPYEMTVRLTIIPGSIAMTLFPAFSALKTAGQDQHASKLFHESVKYLALISGTVVLVLVLLARPLLRLWLGPEFAAHSATVLQVLSVGVLFNSFAYIPVSLLQSVDRPDLPSKLAVLELPFYLFLAWVLTLHYGITGAACATCLRYIADALLLLYCAYRVLRKPRPADWLAGKPSSEADKILTPEDEPVGCATAE